MNLVSARAPLLYHLKYKVPLTQENFAGIHALTLIFYTGMDHVSTTALHLYRPKYKVLLQKQEISVGTHANHPNIYIGISLAQVIAQFLWSDSTFQTAYFVSFLVICQIFTGTKIYPAEKNVIFRLSSSIEILFINVSNHAFGHLNISTTLRKNAMILVTLLMSDK